MNASLLLVLGSLVTVVVAATALIAVSIVTANAASRVRHGSAPTGTDAPSPSAAYIAARRHATVVGVLAWSALVMVGLLAAWLVPGTGSGLSAGVVTGLVPALAGAAALVVHAVGELTWPRPTGAVRRAPLMRRTVAGIAPRGLRRLLWAWASGIVVTLVVCGLASVDGRSVQLTWGTDAASSAGPFPGWFYGVPLLVATTAVLGAAEIVLRLVARRPAVVDTVPEDDLALRAVSARRVLQSAQLVLALTLSGVLFFAGHALRSVGTAQLDGVLHESVAHVVGGSALPLLGIAIAAVSGAAAASRPRRSVTAPLRSIGPVAGTPSGRQPA